MIDATLVTIHGFWSSPATWDRLTHVWRTDLELPGLRIHAFGYPSPKKPRLPFSVTRVPDYDDIAQTLATEYATVLADASKVVFVTHSQGGLILQRFLAWMVTEGRARELSRIRSVVMLACPNGGPEYLESLRRTLGYGRHPQARSLQMLDRQVADTQRIVLQRIVNAAGIDDHKCHIPFHVYAGGSDNIVKAASAQAAFPGASTIAGNHFTILKPATQGNRTAETVKRHVLADAESMPEVTAEPEAPDPSARRPAGVDEAAMELARIEKDREHDRMRPVLEGRIAPWPGRSDERDHSLEIRVKTHWPLTLILLKVPGDAWFTSTVHMPPARMDFLIQFPEPGRTSAPFRPGHPASCPVRVAATARGTVTAFARCRNEHGLTWEDVEVTITLGGTMIDTPADAVQGAIDAGPRSAREPLPAGQTIVLRGGPASGQQVLHPSHPEEYVGVVGGVRHAWRHTDPQALAPPDWTRPVYDYIGPVE